MLGSQRGSNSGVLIKLSKLLSRMLTLQWGISEETKLAAKVLRKRLSSHGSCLGTFLTQPVPSGHLSLLPISDWGRQHSRLPTIPTAGAAPFSPPTPPCLGRLHPY